MELLIGLGFVAMIVQLLLRRNSDIETIRPNIPRPGQINLPNMDQLRGVFDNLKELAEEAQQQGGHSGARLPTREERDAVKAMVRRGQFVEAIEFYKQVYGVNHAAAKRAVDKLMLGGGSSRPDLL